MAEHIADKDREMLASLRYCGQNIQGHCTGGSAMQGPKEWAGKYNVSCNLQLPAIIPVAAN